jgi:hypothetical protein
MLYVLVVHECLKSVSVPFICLFINSMVSASLPYVTLSLYLFIPVLLRLLEKSNLYVSDNDMDQNMGKRISLLVSFCISPSSHVKYKKLFVYDGAYRCTCITFLMFIVSLCILYCVL